MMRYISQHSFKKNNSGVMLIVVLWILIILTIFVVGLGRRTSIELLKSRFYIDKLKTDYLAKAGIVKAMSEIARDSQSSNTKDFDNLYQCGLDLSEEKIPEDIFKDIALGEGFFKVGYQFNPVENSLSEFGDNENPNFFYGLIDEERKINLNAINLDNYRILEELMSELDIEEEDLKVIAASILDWIDSDSEPFNAPYGAEDEYYAQERFPYHCKNSILESLEELFLIKGMNQGIFNKIKPYITIYPIGQLDLQVNINTASNIVLLSLVRASLENRNIPPGLSQLDADNLAQKIIDYRDGDDNIELTSDDRSVVLSDTEALQLNPNEESLFEYLSSNNFFVENSNNFRINSQGFFQDGKVNSLIEVVIERENLSIIYWRED